MNFDKKKNKITGNLGEDLAAEYLERKGYKIIDRNINLEFGEIDILANFRGQIVVVEVKTVRGDGFGRAQDLVRFAKQNKLRRLALSVSQSYPNKSIRIDVIAVDLSHGGEPIFEHIENAVEG
jgi:putative endonuclease